MEALFERNDLSALFLNGRETLRNHIGIRHVALAVSVESLGNILSDDIVTLRELQRLETVAVLGYTVILPSEVICSFALAGSARAFSNSNEFLVVSYVEEISLDSGNIAGDSNCLGHVEPLDVLIVCDITESEHLTVFLKNESLVITCGISLLVKGPT